MSLRTLRRFIPRGIPRAQAETSPAYSQAALTAAVRRPARSLNTIRDLAVGDGSYGALAAAALAGLVGIMYFKKNSDGSDGEETMKEVSNQEPVNEPISDLSNRTPIKTVDDVDNLNEANVNASFKENGSDFSLENYLAEMTEAAAAYKMARQKREVSGNSVSKVAEVEVMNKEEEAAMKARFEGWMKEYGRTYKNEEEKSRRYEIFKSFAKGVDKATANARGGAIFITNHTADWTEEEFRSVYCSEVDWDDYLDEIKYFIAKKRAKEEQGNKKLEGNSAEGSLKADNSEA